jgi:sugar diacid utilization regulator
VVLPLDVRRGLEGAPVPLVHSVHSGGVVLLAQDVEPGWLAELATRLGLDGEVGIGLRRSALRGAALSVGDARLALAAASGERRLLSFADVWAEACLAAEAERLEPLLARGAAVAAAHPHLASTVLAYVAADMSLARTADELHLHANSVTYRLARWAQLSGEDPRTFTGLTRSAAACRLAVRRDAH